VVGEDRAVAEAEVVVTLPDTADAAGVALGDARIYARAYPGTPNVDCPTPAPGVRRPLSGAGAERDMRVLDTPVRGGPGGTALLLVVPEQTGRSAAPAGR
jgi:3-hydroxyisobutyrate dehydrogenase-like beta-hydroxyacid dehydrogenase